MEKSLLFTAFHLEEEGCFPDCDICTKLDIPHKKLYLFNSIVNDFPKKLFQKQQRSFLTRFSDSYRVYKVHKEIYKYACLASYFEKALSRGIEKILTCDFKLPVISTCYAHDRIPILFMFASMERLNNVIDECDGCIPESVEDIPYIRLAPFQISYNNNKYTPPQPYRVKKIIKPKNTQKYYESLESGIIALHIKEVWIVESDCRLPFKDYTVNAFRDLFEDKIDYEKDNYVAIWGFEWVPTRKNKDITVGLINKKLINYVEKLKIDEEAIDLLFNPVIPKQKNKNKNKKKKLTTEPIEKIIEERVSLTSGSDTEEEEDREDDGYVIVNKPVDLSFYEKFEFAYNRNYLFDMNERNVIEESIKELLYNQPKFNKLFEDYKIIRVIKPMEKKYTDDKYFNVILYNNEINKVSPQYHIYLNEENKIINITKIQSLFE